MTIATQKSNAARASEKKAENKGVKKAATAQRIQNPEAAKPPAYMQAKLAVSHPQDSAEKEADKVAQQVARAANQAPATTKIPSEKKAQRASLEPGITPEKADTLALKPLPAAESIQRRPAPASGISDKSLDKKEEAPATPGKGSTTNLQRQAVDPIAGQPTSADTENRIEARRGAGNPLPDTVAAEMSSHFNQDFSAVRIHNDNDAADLCAETNARAFTVDNDIFFAPGEFRPETDSGEELLAHELTHVVQQGGEVRRLMRDLTPSGGAPAAGGGGSSGAATPVFDVSEPFELPPIKSRHGGRYQAMARAGQLRRNAGSTLDRDTAQRSIWMEAVHPDLTRIPPDQRPTTSTGFRLRLNVRGGNRVVEAPDQAAFENLIKIPSWDNTGAEATYQVDHVVEHQLGGPDAIDNMELLNQTHNASVGSSFRFEIRDAVTRTINARPPTHPSFTGLPGAPSTKPSTSDVLTNRITEFRNVAATGAHERRRREGDSTFWSRDSIVRLEHVLCLLDTSLRERQGTASMLSILSPTGGLVVTKIAHGAQASNFPVPRSQQSALSGFRMLSVQLLDGYNTAAAGSMVGSLSVELNLGSAITVPSGSGAFPINLVRDDTADFAVRISSDALSNLPTTVELTGASPIDLRNFSVGNGLFATAILRPTHPLLAGLQLPGRIDNGRLGLFYTLDATTAAERLRIPGVEITSASVTLGFDGEQLSAGGGLEFAIRNFGEGSLSAELDSEGNYSLTGRFQADTRLFDQAEIELWYRSNSGFGGNGTLAITNPDKIRGIRSASITARYDNSVFSAAGNVEPNIPGVQQAMLTVSQSAEEGLTIGGTLQLSANPAISSGSVEVTLRKLEDTWKVSASGTAQPAIPGINSQLDVNYDDGAFTAEFSGAYARGMLSGNATVGTTNRTVGEDGRPSGEAAPNAPLVVYGNGSATMQIAPWLQGTAGIRFAPNGEVTVAGEIGLPSQLEIFSRKEINRPLFAMSTQIPIFPGIVAEVGGNLSAQASIGPGALDQLRIGIEYNPSHEENTHVTGDAHLNIPAEAGVRLGARAGIGLGITGASATGGLELGGTLGISGAAEAGVHIDWLPSTGLGIDAEGYLHAEPKFKFDVSGYVAVTALGFSVYDNRWELAAYELGSNLRLGVRFPIHYREGEPFDVSLADVQFEVPDVDPAAMISDLGSRIF